MTVEQEKRINDIIVEYVLFTKDEKYAESFRNLLVMYTDRFKENKMLYEFLTCTRVYSLYRNKFIKLEGYMRYIALVSDYDNISHYSNEQLGKIICSATSILDYKTIDKSKDDFDYSDFEIFNIISDLYNHYYNDDIAYCYSSLLFYFIFTFIFALYKNLSMILGYKFDLNNYDTEEVERVIYDYYNEFIKPENLECIEQFISLNSINDIPGDAKVITIALDYGDSFIKNRYKSKKEIH